MPLLWTVSYKIYVNKSNSLIFLFPFVLDRDTQYGRVGAPLTVSEIRLVNWEEGGYRITNKPYPQVSFYFGISLCLIIFLIV